MKDLDEMTADEMRRELAGWREFAKCFGPADTETIRKVRQVRLGHRFRLVEDNDAS